MKQTAREQILTLASQEEMQGNNALPLGVETATLQKIIGEAFSDMHSSMIVGRSTLFLGALIAAIFIHRTFPQQQNSSTSAD